METRPELGLASYDRMFPNQDWMPEGGFGNLIALPLQREPRIAGNSVFIDDQDQPFPDQWEVLAKIDRINQDEIASRIRDNSRDGNFLGVEMVGVDEAEEDSWSHISTKPIDLFHAVSKVRPIPNTATVLLRFDGEICVRLSDDEGRLLPSVVKNKLIRLAAFQNPEFYQAQRLRLNTFQIPRVIGCAVEENGWLRLPRGLETNVREFLTESGFNAQIQDDRNNGQPIEVNFAGALRADQQKVVDAVLSYETGVLCAPTGFGKTVLACAILSSRKVNTLILVHRGQLVDQWRSQLPALLDIPNGQTIGIFGKGTKKLGGYIDVATIQSLYQGQKVDPLVKNYGQIIMDECHHVSAFSFEQVLRSAPARFVLGLTATPIRRDGLHPIMFMQCGPVRIKVKRQKTDMAHQQKVIWRAVPPCSAINNDMNVTALYAALTQDSIRTDLIVSDILACLEQGRFPLILTDRKAHLDFIHQQLAIRTKAAIAVLYGGQGKKVRAASMKLIAESNVGDRAVLATGKLIGEGFDLPDLDTLIIALPISWQGTLQQYVGRLSRNRPGKSLIQVYDYLDQSHPILLRMVEKRRTGYKMLGFETYS